MGSDRLRDLPSMKAWRIRRMLQSFFFVAEHRLGEIGFDQKDLLS